MNDTIETTVDETSTLIPKVFYRGPENYASIVGSSGTQYVFSQESGYSVQPVTWEDFYEILLIDRFNVFNRIIVLSDDPISSTNLRRVAPEDVVVSTDIYEAQAVVDTKFAKKQELLNHKNIYIGKINLQIAQWVLEEIPEHLEKDAEKYAVEQYKAGLEKLKEDQEALEAIGKAQVQAEEQLPDPVLEPLSVDDTAVIDEVPVVDTPVVLENTSDEKSDTVPEPTDDLIIETSGEPEPVTRKKSSK